MWPHLTPIPRPFLTSLSPFEQIYRTLVVGHIPIKSWRDRPYGSEEEDFVFKLSRCEFQDAAVEKLSKGGHLGIHNDFIWTNHKVCHPQIKTEIS